MTRFEALLEGYLTGELSSEEEREFAELIVREDHRRILETHERTARLLAALGRPTLSSSFTEEVLARLPERRHRQWETIWEILWAPRVLRWNLASALALSLVLVATPLVVTPLAWRTSARRTSVPSEQRLVVTAVRFTLDAPGARQVALAGDFNGWRTEEVFLSDTTGRGHFSGALPLKPGRYGYMFVVDSTMWVTDPRAEAYRDDGFGNLNAVITIENADQGHGET